MAFKIQGQKAKSKLEIEYLPIFKVEFYLNHSQSSFFETRTVEKYCNT